MATITPYLVFNGNCEEAFNFYKSVFGVEFSYIGRFKDAPSEEPLSESEGEKIMHVTLPIGDNHVLMGSDTSETHGLVTFGSNFSISINAESKEEATALFDGLSAGGQITMPLQDTFWGAYFGMFVDKFGIQWMVNYDTAEQAV
ncbi:VOC family protein [Arcicella rosea]|uniref:PhnB protein n=1 Tax=Arcicella rosea TaxID=502909 RepID=A0A841ELP8_9BACT|nr:VOC family protein [Arcicella rosea]MBB6002349.1 PhnB protein [Arcicella rosea]